MQHIAVELGDQATTLGERYEGVGHEQPARRVLPTDERFDAANCPSRQVRLRLVMHDELAGLEGRSELGGQLDPTPVGRVVRGVEDLESDLSFLGGGQRDPGPPQTWSPPGPDRG